MAAGDTQPEQSIRDVLFDKHQVVVIGSWFRGLFGTKALRKADGDATTIARRPSPPSSSPCSTRW